MAKSTEVWVNPDMSVMETHFIHIFWEELYERIWEARQSGKENINFIITGEEFEDKFYEIKESDTSNLIILKIERNFYNFHINTIINQVNSLYNCFRDHPGKYKVEYMPMCNIIQDNPRHDIIDHIGLIIYPQIKKKK